MVRISWSDWDLLIERKCEGGGGVEVVGKGESWYEAGVD